MSKLRDRLWLWGQDAGSHYMYDIPGINRMQPIEGAEYLGIPNMCRVVMGGAPEPPFDAESEKLVSMNQVVWSAVGSSLSARNDNDQSDLEEVLRQADMFPNVTGAVLDDFFTTPETGRARHSIKSIQDLRTRLHNFHNKPLDLWGVWYEEQLNYDVADYLELCDVITYWDMWASDHLQDIDNNIAKVITKTPAKRRLAGCYMWHYGEHKPLAIPEIQTQCEKYYNWIKKGDLEGIIFCSNCCADAGLEAVEWVREWIREMGDVRV